MGTRSLPTFQHDREAHVQSAQHATPSPRAYPLTAVAEAPVAPLDDTPPTDPELPGQIAAQWDTLYATAIHWADGKVDVAEDLVQSAIMRGLQYQHRFQPDTNLKGWLVTIMKHLWFDQLAKTKRQGPRVSLDGIAEKGHDIEADVPDPEARAVAAATVEEARRAAAALPDHYWRVLEMAAEDIGFREIAARLEMPLGSAHSAAFRARRELKRLLDGDVDRGDAAPARAAAPKRAMKVRRQPQEAEPAQPLALVEQEPEPLEAPRVVQRAATVRPAVPMEERPWREQPDTVTGDIYGWSLIRKLALMRAWVRQPRRRRLVELADQDLLAELRPLTARIGILDQIVRVEYVTSEQTEAGPRPLLKLTIRILNARDEDDDPIECEWLAAGEPGAADFSAALDAAHVSFWRHTLLLLERRRVEQLALPGVQAS